MRTASPYRWISATFALLIVCGTLLLMLPIARTGAAPWADGTHVPVGGIALPGGAPLSVALFTATSASCVTGLSVVDTPTYWSSFGHVVILCLAEIGGIGTMTVAALLARMVRHRLSLRTRNDAAVAASSGLGDINAVLTATVSIAVGVQAGVAAILTTDFVLFHGYSFGKAVWYGVFHAGSAYNNAGFALYTDSLVGLNRDPLAILTIAAAIIIGGIGFPVLMELGRGATRTLHTRVVLHTTALLLVAGTAFIALCEWSNRSTLGPMSIPLKIVNAFFSAVTPRTAGFNSLDMAAQHPSTWFGIDILMFVGAAPVSTGGGLKVTTLAVVVAVTWSQVRGMDKIHMGRWRLAEAIHGQVVTLLGLALSLIVATTMLLMAVTPYRLDQCLFETISAFATVGLTTGITPSLPLLAQLTLVALMLVGRVGPFTLAAALTMRREALLYDRPVGTVLIG